MHINKLWQIRCTKFLLLLHFNQETVSSFVQISNEKTCICPGDVLVFECTVMGGSAIVWRGTPDFFACSTSYTINQEIILRHNLYAQGIVTTGTCNNGSIVGHIIRAENGNYTSQLNVTLTSDLSRVTIECLHDDGSTLSVVGNSSIDPKSHIPPPNTIFTGLVDVNTNQITFNWSPVVSECLSLHYNILSSNCGSCPTTTTNTTVTCTDVPTDGSMCTFAVQTVVCGNIVGNMSDQINIITLKDDNSGNDNNNNATAATISASLFAGLFFASVIILVLVVAMLILRERQRAKNEVSAERDLSLSTRHYEDVSLQPASTTVVDTERNIAYGQVQKLVGGDH